ncbi:MAG: hypothetical protein KC442_18050, partial [Thermomicrobiales bacterium]|nr:hypothetical protein [Thermomicrobiales bacterium]
YIEAALAGVDLTDATAKSAAVRKLAPLVEAAGDRVVQDHYAGLVARKLQLSMGAVQREIRSTGVRSTASRESRLQTPTLAAVRTSHEDYLLALLLKFRGPTFEVLPLVSENELNDTRNRELLRVLQDPSVPVEIAPELVIAGLDNLVADHAEALLASLEQAPAQFPGQIARDAKRALFTIGRERFDTLMRQLQRSIAEAEQTEDIESLSSLITQLSVLSAQHRSFYPEKSPYFRDSRDTDRSQAV